MQQYEIIAIGASHGGMEILSKILPNLPDSFTVPILVTQHLKDNSGKYFVENLREDCVLPLVEAVDKETIELGHIYIAPAGYHMMVDYNHTISLSVDDKINYARPAVDILFESVAHVYGSGALGILLTGANSDGARGLQRLHERGGTAIVQDPETAASRSMPQSAIDLFDVDEILTPDNIIAKLQSLVTVNRCLGEGNG